MDGVVGLFGLGEGVVGKGEGGVGPADRRSEDGGEGGDVYDSDGAVGAGLGGADEGGEEEVG